MHTLLPGLTVGTTHEPIDLDEVWVQWLGTIQAESFRKSSLFITAQQSKERGWDEAFRPVNLANRVRLVHSALVLQGCGYNSEMLMIEGTFYGSNVKIGPIHSGLSPCYHPDFRNRRRITNADLKRAAVILQNLETVYEHAPKREYRRTRKGFNLWIKGIEEGYDLNERLHFFVRAVEAIVRPTIANKRRKAIASKQGGRPSKWREVTETFVGRG